VLCLLRRLPSRELSMETRHKIKNIADVAVTVAEIHEDFLGDIL
jgi:hypothetical protein